MSKFLLKKIHEFHLLVRLLKDDNLVMVRIFHSTEVNTNTISKINSNATTEEIREYCTFNDDRTLVVNLTSGRTLLVERDTFANWDFYQVGEVGFEPLDLSDFDDEGTRDYTESYLVDENGFQSKWL